MYSGFAGGRGHLHGIPSSLKRRICACPNLHSSILKIIENALDAVKVFIVSVIEKHYD
jgi:hypothetical protein